MATDGAACQTGPVGELSSNLAWELLGGAGICGQGQRSLDWTSQTFASVTHLVLGFAFSFIYQGL